MDRFINCRKILVIFIIIFFISSCSPNDSHDPAYHSPEALNKYLNQINLSYSNITYLESIGTSAEGRTIRAISISENPDYIADRPKIRLTGSIHGDENATTEVLVRLIDYLMDKYTSGDSYIKSLISTRYIVIIPMLNPDGVVIDSRWNANGVDLNRNFSKGWMSGTDHGDAAFSEPESQAVRDYSVDMVFNSSLTFHTGAVIVNKPFDYGSEHRDPSILPLENSLVDYLAFAYSRSGIFLQTPGLLSAEYVVDGTINGGDWYIVNGSLQDWSYTNTGCVDLTVEITNTIPETKEELDDLFKYNRDSILAYVEASGIGIYGRVVDSGGNPINNASISIYGGDLTVYSDSSGYYRKLLLAGDYTVTFSAGGYTDHPETVQLTTEIQSKELNVVMSAK